MMGQGNDLSHFDQQGIMPLKDFGAHRGMALHDLPLSRIEAGRLEQDMVGDPYFADIMQRTRVKDQFDGFLVAIHGGRHAPAVVAHPLDVHSRIVVAVLRRARQPVDDLELRLPHCPGAFPDLRIEDLVLILQGLHRAFQGKVGPDPGLHFHDLKGFCDVIDRTESETLGFVANLAHCGNEDHGNGLGGAVGFQPGTNLIAVHPRHHDIEQDKVRGIAFDLVQCSRAAGSHADFVVVAQRRHDDVQVDLGIIDEENPTIGKIMLHFRCWLRNTGRKSSPGSR